LLISAISGYPADDPSAADITGAAETGGLKKSQDISQ
jgi:hypothetical protein